MKQQITITSNKTLTVMESEAKRCIKERSIVRSIVARTARLLPLGSSNDPDVAQVVTPRYIAPVSLS